MTAIQAIETRYAGCRFRSRLEARWAVFFDAMSIRWEYELQGLAIQPRLSDAWGGCEHKWEGTACFCEPITFPYLPDFWLPDWNLWVEVKGSLNDDETLRLLNAAAYLSSNGGSGCGYDNGGHDLVVLGSVPRPGSTWGPARLHMHKGDLSASNWLSSHPHSGEHWHLATDFGGGTLEGILSGNFSKARTIEILLGGMPGDYPTIDDRIGDAYRAARSARFEHGE